MLKNNKIVFMFNKLFIDFLKDVKETSPILKNSIRKNYRVINKLSIEHLEKLWEGCQPHFTKFVSLSIPELNDDEEINSIFLVKDLAISNILQEFQEQNDVFWNHVIILIVFAYLYHENNQDDIEVLEDHEDHEDVSDSVDALGDDTKDDQVDQLFYKVCEVLSTLQKGEDVSKELDDVLDEDLKGLLSKVTYNKLHLPTAELPQQPPQLGDMFGKLPANSKIGRLAEEIAKDVDLSKLNIQNPSDIMNMITDFGSSNNVMSDIIKKASNTIHNKLSSGELNQDELLSEAMGMMSFMGKNGGMADILNNPMVSEIMKNLKKGKPMQTKTDVNKSGTHERLKRKLDERKHKKP
jgi:hypothetical protein